MDPRLPLSDAPDNGIAQLLDLGPALLDALALNVTPAAIVVLAPTADDLAVVYFVRWQAPPHRQPPAPRPPARR